MPEFLLSAEDAKLVTLARSTRVRVEAPAAAAVRDDTGRTYVGAALDLPALRLTALETAVAAAVSSGVRVLEAAAVVTEAPDTVDVAVVADLAAGPVPVHVAVPNGTVVTTLTAG